jgi:predicted NAD/FAD-binding protein
LGGGRNYVSKMLAGIPDARVATPVTRVRRSENGVVVTSAAGDERFDAVVFACHAPTTLALLDANEQEAALLSAFRYQPNTAWLHTDRALLPRREAVWSAWNYLAGPATTAGRPVVVSYLINKLQPLPFKTPVIVTLNPETPPRADTVLGRFDYEHPIMDAAAIAAQKRLHTIQGIDRAWFCGAWSGYGFHEDGLKSALRVVRDFGITPPWTPDYGDQVPAQVVA